MSSLDEVIAKIPRPILVGTVFIIALVVIVLNKPLQNGCDVQISNFTNNVKGYLINTRNSAKKLRLAEVNTTKNACKMGNSAGACENYFSAIKIISDAFVTFDHSCIPQLKENETFVNLEGQLKDAVRILALLSWGEKPPAGLAERAGWLSRREIYTFCRLKTVLAEVVGEDGYKNFRETVFKEYPDVWPDKLKNEAQGDEINRPLAYKTASNPSGTLNQSEVMQRSLFSLRCDQYQ